MALRRSDSIVVLRGLGLGDMCTVVPALRGLHRAFPDQHLVLAGPTWAGDLLTDCGVDRVVATAGTALPEPVVEELRGTVAVAVNLHGRGPQSTRSLRRLGSPRLMAFRGRPHRPWEGPAWRRGEHEVARWCRLLAHWGIDTDPHDLSLDAPALRSDLPTDAVVVHPGAAAAARRWPPERFATVVRWLRSAGHRVVLTGSDDEAGLCRTISRLAGVTDESGHQHDVVLAGTTSVTDLAALVARAVLTISNDTGVAHLATAYGTASVTLFGTTPPGEWGPPSDGPHAALWAGHHGDPHGAVVDPGLLEIGVQDVLEAATQLLGDRRSVGAQAEAGS